MFEVCILHGYFLNYNVCLLRLGNVSICTSACLGSTITDKSSWEGCTT